MLHVTTPTPVTTSSPTCNTTNNTKHQQQTVPTTTIQAALQAPTSYVWLVDDDVIPGKRFLEVIGSGGGGWCVVGWWFVPPL